MDALSLQAVGEERPSSDGRPIGHLEVLSRGGKVTQRLPVYNERIHVGRAYDNDLVIDDPFVCPHHLTLAWDGQELQVADLQSLNGISVDDRKSHLKKHGLKCGRKLRIGRTMLRFRSARFAVAPTRIDDKGLIPLALFEHPLGQVAAFLLLVGLFLLDTYLDSASKFEPLEAALGTAFLVISIFIWSALWSFASRIMVQQWKFWCHNSVAFTGMILLMLSSALLEHFTFACGLDNTYTQISMGVNFLLVGTILYLHLHFVSLAPLRRLLIGGFGVSALFVGLLVMFDMADKDGYNHRPEYSVTLKAPAFKLVGSQNTDTFFAEATTLLAEVKTKVAEADEEE